jgi:class 3 adenylate cyclase/predicted ATPase/DNA-binding transcriptional ArsR family regulator
MPPRRVPRETPPHETDRSAGDIGAWLRATGLGKYEDTFRRNEIDVAILGDLTSDDLREMEIPLGDRKRLLKAIAARSATPAREAPAPAVSAGGEAVVERRQLTILFCDLVGYTELSGRLDPEDVADTMRGYRACCTEVLARWDGYIAKFLGDGVLAYFGWPRAHEDDATRAVHAGLALCEAVSRMCAHDGTSLAARVGIATGLVMVGEVIGEGASLQEAVVGATPNLAARLQALARPGSVVVAATTRALLGDQFALSDLGVHAMKGFAEPVRAWGVEGTGAATTRFEARSGHAVTPIVGRDRETRRLIDAWSRAAAGRGQVVAIAGEAGIGKSRLVLALVEHVRGTPHSLFQAQCSPFHTTTVLHPFLEQVGRLARLGHADTADGKLDKLEAWIARTGLDVADSAPLYAALMGVPFEHRFPPIPVSPQRLRERTAELFTRFVVRQAVDAQALVIVEDVHWADPTTLTALEHLVDRVASERALLVVTSRPGFDPPWLAHANVTAIALDRVSRSAAREMVGHSAGNKALPADVLDLILARTDGVPLFVEELTRTVIESGQLRDAGDRYELQGAAPDLSIPATLRDSLAARLDRLEVNKELAQVGATIGRTFAADLLADVMGIPEPTLRKRLDVLSEAGIVEPRGSGTSRRYAFRHALIQEVSYESLLRTSRRTIHARIAEALEARYPGVIEAQPETLAHHLAEAGASLRAAEYLLAASRKALRVAATSEAIAHVSRGLELVEGLPRSAPRDLTTLRLHASLGTAYMLARGWAAPEVETAYAAANALSHAASDPGEAVWILWGIWVHSHVRGRIDQAIAMSRRIRDVAVQYGDPDALLIADMITLQVNCYAGRLDDAVASCSAMESAFRPERHRSLINLYSTDLELVSLVHRSLALWIRGAAGDALALARQAERLARGLEHPYSVAWSLTWGAMPLLLQGDLDALMTRLEEGLAIAAEHDYAYLTALGTMMRGWADAQRGQLLPGIGALESGLAAFQATGAEIVVPHFRTLLAELLGRAGRTDEALEQLRLASEQIERWGERWQEAEVHRVRADVLSGSEHPRADVERGYERAIAVADAQGARAWSRRAREGLARHLSRHGEALPNER